MVVGFDGDFIVFYLINEKGFLYRDKNLFSYVCRSFFAMYCGYYYVILSISLCKLVFKMDDFFDRLFG